MISNGDTKIVNVEEQRAQLRRELQRLLVKSKGKWTPRAWRMREQVEEWDRQHPEAGQ